MTGYARSGTSAVCGALHKMGVYMTPHVERTRHDPAGLYEDPELRKLLLRHQSHGFPPEGAAEFQRYIDRRAAEGRPLWGFKTVRGLWYIEDVTFPCPVRAVAVLRDLEAVRRSYAATPALGMPPLEEVTVQVRGFLRRWREPLCVIHFEDLLADPEATVRLLADFVTGGSGSRLDVEKGIQHIDPRLRRF